MSLSTATHPSTAPSSPRGFDWGIVTAAIALGAALVSAWIAGSWGAAALRDRAHDSLAAAAGLLANDLGQEMQDRLDMLAWLTGRFQALDLAADAPRRQRWLDAVRAGTPGVVWVGIASPAGLVTDGSDGLLVGRDLAARDWHRRGLQGPALADLHPAHLLQPHLPPGPDGEPERLVDLGAPLRDSAGRLRGVLGVQVAWSWIVARLEEDARPLPAEVPTRVRLLAADGTVLAAAQRGTPRAVDWGAPLLRVERPLVNGVVPRDLGWRIAVEQPRALVEAPARAFALRSGLVAGTLGLLATLLAAAARRRVHRRLAAAQESVFSFARLVPGGAYELLRAPDGCWSGTVLAADGRAATWHRPGRRFGSDLPGFPADQRQRLGASLDAAVAAADRPEARPEEVTIWRADPALGQRWFRCVHRARRDPDRGVVVEGLAIDVTDLKRAEAAAARARALEEENRRLAEDRAAAADRLARQRSEILAVMAHEIRTPLTGLLGFTELLAEAGLPAGPHRHAAQALQGGRDLLTIVNDILHLAKLEAGKGTIERLPFDPAAELRQALALCRAQAAGKGLTLALELAPDLPGWVAGDPTRLRQVMLNLLSNAVKFTTRGEVALRARPVAPDRLRVEVRDSGIGIAPEALPRLFTMFEQAESGTARRFGGTGLGLAICRRLVDAMGGTLGAESVPGEGSLFWFELPLPAAEAPGPVAAAPAPPALVTPLDVLVVDDVAPNRELIRAFLAAAGHRPALAADGAAALALVAERRFDLILMDVSMPGMDGLEATRRIRAGAGPNARTPILALSAAATGDEVEDALAAGMDSHLAKPIDRAALLAAVRRAAPAAGLLAVG
ncbi:ATP-binding protein [Dankookia sp. GCM10030260]|uniref:ATP-binding protein n=1 Tax=Dankookia sp. GCM10030260 TaxID=3273390 RepID=UPI0036232B87